MLATLAEHTPLRDEHLIYEPKYDGIRALIEVEPAGGAAGIRIWSRLGNDKTAQFPEIVRALAQFARKLRAPVVLDGEIVALDSAGRASGFQRLQGRIHLAGLKDNANRSSAQPAAFIAFDLLRDGADDLRSLPLVARRARLERVFVNTGSPLLRLSDFVPGDGRVLYDRALEQGAEGLVAKHADSQYKSGQRTLDWRKLKIVHRQEFVVGGWTDPRASRPYFGALLLGVYDERSALHYVGHTGSGFNDTELARVAKLLDALKRPTCPFINRPRTNERPHWVHPKLVAEVKFTEWTDDGKLRHPIYLGLRDDVKAEDVRREQDAPGRASESPPSASEQAQSPVLIARRDSATSESRSRRARPRLTVSAHGRSARSARTAGLTTSEVLSRVIDQLRTIEDRRGNGLIHLPAGDSIEVTNLHKVFWPGEKLTKGDLLRYYVEVSPYLLPAVQDRPLVMKRFPNGVQGKAFYQQRAPDPVPEGIRTAVMASDTEVPSRLIGGSLKTLLYMTQIAAISQDPWFSRVESPDFADHVAIDLDPMPGVSFAIVLDVARWVRDELDALNIEGVPKTSGAAGLHVYIPLPPKTTYDAGLLFCQIIATVVARKHPRVATVERSVRARGRTVYIDYLQNIRGKTLATAYSARASEFAGASTPLSWKEVDSGVTPRDFTIRTLPGRLREAGDLWAQLRRSKGIDLRAVMKYAG